LLGACATPPLERYLLQADAGGEQVRLKGTRGFLSADQSRAVIDRLKQKTPDSGILERHIAIEEALAGNALSVGNRAVLLEDGEQTYAAMLSAIKAAKHHVHMETYIFEADDVGKKFAAALAERARAGLKVRLIYDAVGSIKTPKEFFDGLAAKGVEVVAFNPLAPGAVLKSGLEAINHRDHRKLIVVDGRVAFLGGINISGVYSSPSSSGSSAGSRPSGKGVDNQIDSQPWRDMQTRIVGPVVADLQRAFLQQWATQRKEPLIEDKAYYPQLAPQGPHVVRAIEGSPAEDGVNAMYVAFISAIDNAEKEVMMMNPYFVPHERLVQSLEEAARRGVEVKLILPSRSDSWLAFYAGRSFYEHLLDAGVKIFERNDRILHAKTATVDGVWSTVGSTNLDWRSLLYNDEINAVVIGPEFADQMNAVFRNDLAESSEITRESWHNRSIEERIKEKAARAWARWL
jgi:cardiolipin synthase